ncbi:hypothetical protein LTR95_009702 [Oleoguttula sp. CCFEE 5521]
MRGIGDKAGFGLGFTRRRREWGPYIVWNSGDNQPYAAHGLSWTSSLIHSLSTFLISQPFEGRILHLIDKDELEADVRIEQYLALNGITMSTSTASTSRDGRPKALHPSRSFTRMELPTQDPLSPRKRASTIQVSGIPTIPEARHIDTTSDVPGKSPRSDVFENGHADDEHEASGMETSTPELKLPTALDELPIEIRSLTERFLESLNAKVHPAPLSADVLSDMFQDFYERAASQISTHIAILTARIGRRRDDDIAAPRTGKTRARAGSGAKRGGSPASLSGGEMLTPSEVSHRKKARRALEVKRLALEEAVERSVCEKMYDRIWKHRSTDDDARDGKLRSRTAALSLVGIGLKELHQDQEAGVDHIRKTAEENEAQIFESLAPAREALQRMDDEHHPLGKLQHLTAAHKSVVETLSQVFPASSSADEILPTLIYTLITTPPEGLDVISNLNFIQRFRASSKVDGEAAYCLVNLEASISFLETVDLSSLRPDECPEGPAKSASRPSTPSTEKQSMLQPATPHVLKPETSPISAVSSDQSTKPLPLSSPTTPVRPAPPNRKISSMVQAQADRLEASRDNFLNAADKVYDSINGTLETSLKTLFGRFKDQVPDNSPLPKTLEDARKLVSSPVSPIDEDDPVSGQSSPALTDDPLIANKSPTSTSASENKMLELLAGRKPLRDPSVDSTKSGNSSSGKRVAFSQPAEKEKEKEKEDQPLQAAANFMNSLNPLNRFGVPSFPRFGSGSGNAVKPASLPPTPTLASSGAATAAVKAAVTEEGGKGEDDLNAAEALAELRKIKPPRKRFLEVKDAGELRIGEVDELLKEYRRLAKAIGEAVAL